MASTYTRYGSKFYWIKYRGSDGNQVRESTGIVIDAPGSAVEIKKLRASKTLAEPILGPTVEAHRWENWAKAFLEERYAGRGSLKNARKALVDLLAYFQENNIRTPKQVHYEQARGFLDWYAKGGDDAVSVNTVRVRFVYFKLLMSEAVRRGICDANPCREVEIETVPAKEKEEITLGDQRKIEKALATQPEWMRQQWLVLMRHGCRIAETDVPLERIDTKTRTIKFKIKGGRMHLARLHPDLLPIIATAKAEGRASLLSNPLKPTSWSSSWSHLFTDLKMPYSIHCTRVTVITRLIRAGVSVVDVCNFIGHTAAVNRIYRKLKPADSDGLLEILAGASSPSAGTRKRGKKAVRPTIRARAPKLLGPALDA